MAKYEKRTIEDVEKELQDARAEIARMRNFMQTIKFDNATVADKYAQTKLQNIIFGN